MEIDDKVLKKLKTLKIIGWAVSLVGTAFYLYGYFMDGGASLVAWGHYLPDWALEFIPNWQAELGLVLSIIGFVPLMYVEKEQQKLYAEA